MTVTVAEQWHDMVTVALLGTDRREPPVPIDTLLADLAADERRGSPSQRMLQQTAAIAVLRRAGMRPAAPAEPFVGAPPDDRPITPAAASGTWRRIVGEWPVLEDEWVLTLVRHGWRLAPELVGPQLLRHRGDANRRAQVVAAAGPLARWLVDHQPHLAPSTRRSPDGEFVGELPVLPTLPELADVLEASAADVAAAAAGGLNQGRFGVAHRSVLVNFVARVRVDVLDELAAELDRVDPSRPAIGVAFALADMARLRRRMLAELEIR